ncbi:hypothetical protein [Senegalia massiliensis]|uniref:Uncharacterized protein n=1 Tax=Senegalia massiliensis TaxID=1720316 RepID=A0A845QY69_9CLOT|nr:hypothetical protein [Senegalia massiliensis]NBI06092.1 hypothetical protein [Senegalia massiliensis]
MNKNINRNESLKWANDTKNLEIDDIIIVSNNSLRGVYGIFVKSQLDKDENKKCIYVGWSDNIYLRMFSSNGHITKLKKGIHSNKSLVKAMNNGDKIIIKILEKVKLEFDNYYKDIQRLTSMENKCIDFYQSKGECLEQVPEGKVMSKDKWNDKKLQNQ